MKLLPFVPRPQKRFPFDSKNPTGYLLAVVIEYVIAGFGFIAVASTLGLLVGVYRFALSTITEIKQIIHSMNNKTKARACKSSEFEVFLSELIDTDTAIKQLSR